MQIGSRMPASKHPGDFFLKEMKQKEVTLNLLGQNLNSVSPLCVVKGVRKPVFSSTLMGL